MKKIIYNTVAIFTILIVSGCASTSYYEGAMKDSYVPTPINNAIKENGAIIKVADGMSIFKVDDIRKVNFAKMMFSGGLDSIVVNEGFHTITASRKRDISIGKVMYKSKHEYLINYLEIKEGGYLKIHYWVEDLTNKNVVYGKKVSKKDFIKDKK